MKRIWHQYLKWEDYKNGMWRKVSKDEETELLQVAIDFTGDHVKYGKAMKRVINEWPIACEHNLTDLSQNRKAWIGHAACCIEMGLPEYIVRSAWGKLTDEQRNLANKQAELRIRDWELSQKEKEVNVNQLIMF